MTPRRNLGRRQPRAVYRAVDGEHHRQAPGFVRLGTVDQLRHRALLVQLRGDRLLPRPLPACALQRHRPDERSAAYRERQARPIRHPRHQAPPGVLLARGALCDLRERWGAVVRVYLDVRIVWLF